MNNFLTAPYYNDDFENAYFTGYAARMEELQEIIDNAYSSYLNGHIDFEIEDCTLSESEYDYIIAEIDKLINN